jgi:hypothetical protein
MARFKLKSGTFIRHEDGKMTKYASGDLVEFESVFNIPEGFRNSFEIPVKRKAGKDVVEEEPEGPPESKFEVQHRGGGRYNVMNIETGEAINDEFLSKKEAEALVTVTDALPEEE